MSEFKPKTITEFKEQYSEVKEKRSGFSKTFDRGNGSYTTIVTQYPLHWQDSNSNFQEIDCIIKNGKVKKTVYTAILLTDTIGYSIVADEDSSRIDVKVNKIGDEEITYVSPTIEDNKAVWYDITTDVDFIIEFTPTRVRCWKRLKSAQAAKDITFAVIEDDNEKVLKVIDKIVGYDNNKKITIQKIEKAKEIKYKTNRTKKNVAEYEWKQTFEDKVIVRNETTRVKELSEEVSYPVMIDADVDVQIENSSYDGEDRTAFTAGNQLAQRMTVNNNYNRIAYWADDQSEPYPQSWPWQRFDGVTIPQNSTINSATLNLYMLGNYVDHASVIKVNALDYATPPIWDGNDDGALVGTTTGVMPGIPTTKWVNDGSPISGSINVDNLVSVTLTDTESYLETIRGHFDLFNINVVDIVQELVNTYDYSSDAMLFFQRLPITTGNVGYNRSAGFMVLDRVLDSSKAPQLVINYTPPPPEFVSRLEGIYNVIAQSYARINSDLSGIYSYARDAVGAIVDVTTANYPEPSVDADAALEIEIALLGVFNDAYISSQSIQNSTSNLLDAVIAVNDFVIDEQGASAGSTTTAKLQTWINSDMSGYWTGTADSLCPLGWANMSADAGYDTSGWNTE